MACALIDTRLSYAPDTSSGFISPLTGNVSLAAAADISSSVSWYGREKQILCIIGSRGLQNALDEATGIMDVDLRLRCPPVEIVGTVRKLLVDRLRLPIPTPSQSCLLSVGEVGGTHELRACHAHPLQTHLLAFFSPGGSQVTKAIDRFP